MHIVVSQRSSMKLLGASATSDPCADVMTQRRLGRMWKLKRHSELFCHGMMCSFREYCPRWYQWHKLLFEENTLCVCA